MTEQDRQSLMRLLDEGELASETLEAAKARAKQSNIAILTALKSAPMGAVYYKGRVYWEHRLEPGHVAVTDCPNLHVTVSTDPTPSPANESAEAEDVEWFVELERLSGGWVHPDDDNPTFGPIVTKEQAEAVKAQREQLFKYNNYRVVSRPKPKPAPSPAPADDMPAICRERLVFPGPDDDINEPQTRNGQWVTGVVTNLIEGDSREQTRKNRSLKDADINACLEFVRWKATQLLTQTEAR